MTNRNYSIYCCCHRDGSHVMIEGMPRSMAVGSAFTLTLVFEKTGTKQLQLKLEKAQ